MQRPKSRPMSVSEPNPPSGHLLCNKDLAAAWGVSLRTVSKRLRLLNVMPTVPLHSRNEWSVPDFHKVQCKWLKRVKNAARSKTRIYETTP
jgi:hypothetical protein